MVCDWIVVWFRLNARWQELARVWQREGVLPTAELGDYLWAPGPVVYFLRDVLGIGAFLRCVVWWGSRGGGFGVGVRRWLSWSCVHGMLDVWLGRCARE